MNENSNTLSQGLIEFAGLRVDFARNIVFGSSGEIRLEPKQANLLRVLVENAGDVMTRDDLIERVWDGAAGADQSLTNSISQLRKCLAECGLDSNAIETVPKTGYRFVGDDWMHPGADRAGIGPHAPAKSRYIYLVMIVALLALLAAGFRMFLPVKPSEVLKGQFVISVRDDMTNARPGSDIGAEFRENIEHVFTQNGLLNISESNTKPEGFAEFQFLITLNQSGDDLAATTELIQNSTGLKLWSWQRQRPKDDLNLFKSEIANKSASILNCFLTDRDMFQNENRGEIYNLIVRYCELSQGSSVDFPKLIEVGRRLNELTPDHAASHSSYGAAIAFHLLGRPNLPDSEFQNLQNTANRSLDRALELDPDSGRALWAKAILRDETVGIKARMTYLEQALDRDPNYPYSRNHLGHHWRAVGRSDEAMSYYTRFMDDFTLDEQRPVFLAYLLMTLNRENEAREIVDPLLERFPESSVLKWHWFLAEHWYGNPKAAKELVRQTDQSALTIRCVDFIMDARLAARRLTKSQIMAECENAMIAHPVAYFAYFGDVDAAMDALNADREIFAAPSDAFSRRVLFDTFMWPLHNDIRFFEFTRDIGLVDFWESSGKWPDFCIREDLSYNCKARANRTMDTAQSK